MVQHQCISMRSNSILHEGRVDVGATYFRVLLIAQKFVPLVWEASAQQDSVHLLMPSFLEL